MKENTTGQSMLWARSYLSRNKVTFYHRIHIQKWIAIQSMRKASNDLKVCENEINHIT